MKFQSDKINIGIIGLGHWGPNIVRSLASHSQVNLSFVCDILPSAFTRVSKLIPRECQQTTKVSDIFESPDVDAVVIATTASTHYELVKQALMAKKHVFCEKPLTLDVEHDKELCLLAERFKRQLMVGYTFLFNDGIKKLGELINNDVLGQIYYLTATRTHLGLIRDDVSVVWDLAPHDISIMNYLLGETPNRVSAVGGNPLKSNKADFAFANLFYPSGVIGQIHVSWVDSNKERVIRVIGSKARVVFDDLEDLEPVRIFEKGVGLENRIEPGFGDFKLLLRDGDIIGPKINMREPLKNIMDEFVCVLLDGVQNISDGQFALNITRTLTAIQRSMKNGGAPENIPC